MKAGDLVKNNYMQEIGVVIEEWEDENYTLGERQWYVLYLSGNMVVTSEYDLEVVCKQVI